MKLRHSVVIQADCERVWEMLLNPDQWAQYFPGATLFEVNGSSFVGTVALKIGPLEYSFEGVATYIERIVSEKRAVIDVTGAEGSGLTQTRARIEIQLTAMTNAATHVDISSEVVMAPEPAAFGRAILQDSTGRAINGFVKSLNSALRRAVDINVNDFVHHDETTEIEIIRDGMPNPMNASRERDTPSRLAPSLSKDPQTSWSANLRKKIDDLSDDIKQAAQNSQEAKKRASDEKPQVPVPSKSPQPKVPATKQSKSAKKALVPVSDAKRAEQINRNIAIGISIAIVTVAWWWTSTH